MYAIIAYGAYRVMEGQSSIGSLFAFFIFLTQMFTAGGAVFGLVPAMQEGLVSLKRIYEVLDREAESRGGHRLKRRAVGELVFEGVSFRYGDNDKWALRHIDLRAAPGEVIAVVGRSGAGKSTLVDLVPRLYEPTEGRIDFDGRPTAECNLRWLRGQIGFVRQDTFLFNRTLRENITYAAPEATEADISRVVRDAQAEDFIQRLPKGLETVLGERGARLSGGEKQRISIARELLRDPPLLILDEATSHLDSEGESRVRKAMERVMKDRTCLLIAHRLATVQRADRIIVLDEGRIVEQGTHAELLALGGLYRYLCQIQFATDGEDHTIPDRNQS